MDDLEHCPVMHHPWRSDHAPAADSLESDEFSLNPLLLHGVHDVTYLKKVPPHENMMGSVVIDGLLIKPQH